MKLVFVEESSKIAGVQASTYFLAKWLNKNGFESLKILLPSTGDFSKMCKDNDLQYIIYKSLSPKSTSISILNDKYRIPNLFSWIYNFFVILNNYYSVRKKLKIQLPDIVITKGFYSHFYAGFACKNLKIKCICHLQDFITDRYNGLFIRLFNKVFTYISDFIVCDGQKIFDSLSPDLKKKSNVIINGIDLNFFQKSKPLGLKFRKRNKIPNNAYLIGNLSRMTPWKGQLELLLAFLKYSKVNRNAYLVLAGSPLFDGSEYLSKLKKIIIEHSIQSKVIMPGYINDIRSYLSSLDLYVQPSKEKDTTPLSLLTSFSMGLPSVISKIDSFDEIVDLIPYIDQFEISNEEQLIKLLVKYEEKKIREKIGKLNSENSYKFFDISIHGNKFIKVLRNIL